MSAYEELIKAVHDKSCEFNGHLRKVIKLSEALANRSAEVLVAMREMVGAGSAPCATRGTAPWRSCPAATSSAPPVPTAGSGRTAASPAGSPWTRRSGCTFKAKKVKP